MDNENKKLPNTKSNCQLNPGNDFKKTSSSKLVYGSNQMQKMEAEIKKAETRLKAKDLEIDRLKRKMKEWEIKHKSLDLIERKDKQESNQNQPVKSDFIYKRCLKLEHKIFEMEKFFADSGIDWVHNSKNTSKTLSNYNINEIYSRLIENIKDLNMSVNKGEMFVHRSQGVASFKSAASLTLKFYKNGMIVQNGRLRYYSEPSVKSFLKDILDGYFPSELQQKYPDGVPFKIEDNRRKSYHGDGASYPGCGYQLGKIGSSCQINSTRSFQKHKNSSTSLKSLDNTKESDKMSSRFSHHGRSNSFDTSRSTNGIKDSYFYTSNPKVNKNNSDAQSNMKINLIDSKIEKLNSKNGNQYLPMKTKLTDSKQSGLNLESSFNQRITSSNLSLNPSSSFPNNHQRSKSNLSSISSLKIFDESFSSENINPLDKKLGKLRTTSSITLQKNNFKMPIIQEINKPTGKSDELRLKIRSMNGNVIYMMYISAEDTVGQLYQLLNTVLIMKRKNPRRNTPNYTVVASGYKPRRLDRNEISLKDYGINGDCVLHLIND